MNDWTAIIPVKQWALAKSRLHLLEHQRHAVARALAEDTLAVVAAAPSIGRVVVVTAQKEMLSVAHGCGAHTLTDRPLMSGDPLNTAVMAGRSWAVSRRVGSPLVVVPADLGSLTVDTLEDALEALTDRDTGFVADLAGTGTTLLAARSPELLSPAYGEGSARRHRAGGAREAIGLDPRVRLDVDSRADLAEAQHLGLGPAVSAVMDSILLAVSGAPVPDGRR